MIYTIKHGGISAVMEVRREDGDAGTFIYMNEGKIEATDGSVIKWGQLPLSVALVIIAQFDAVFALPITERQAWIDKQISIEVEVV